MIKYPICEFKGNRCTSSLCGFDNLGECEKRSRFLKEQIDELELKRLGARNMYLCEHQIVKSYNKAFRKILEVLKRAEHFENPERLNATELGYSMSAIAAKKLIDIEKIVLEALDKGGF